MANSQLAALLDKLAPRDNGGYLKRRTNDIYSGFDDLAGEADSVENFLAQDEIMKKTGWAPSRDRIQQSTIGDLRQKFGVMDAEHSNQRELETLKGQFDIQGQREAAKAAAEQARIGQENMMARQIAAQEATDRRLDKTIGAQGARQEDAQQFRVENPPARQSTIPAEMYKALDKAQVLYKGEVGGLSRLFGQDGGKKQLDSALTNFLSRAGELEDALEAVNHIQSGRNPAERVPFGPNAEYIKQFIKLRTGK